MSTTQFCVLLLKGATVLVDLFRELQMCLNVFFFFFFLNAWEWNKSDDNVSRFFLLSYATHVRNLLNAVTARLFYRRISGWSSFWRRSRSLAKSWREWFENWPSRRMIVLGTTAATEHIRTIILTLVWLCVRVYGCIYVSMLVGGQEGVRCVCLCVYLCICLCCVSIFQSHTQQSRTPSLTMMLGVSSLQVLEHDLTFWWNLVCLPDPASLDETKNMPLHEAAQLNQDW